VQVRCFLLFERWTLFHASTKLVVVDVFVVSYIWIDDDGILLYVRVYKRESAHLQRERESFAVLAPQSLSSVDKGIAVVCSIAGL
jgi:hypothetical protein